MQKEDTKQGTEEGLHVEENSGLRCGNLGQSPVPQQGGGGGAEQTAGGECDPHPGCDGGEMRRAKGLGIEQRDTDKQHGGSAGDAVCGNGDWTVVLHQALVDEDPGEGDDEGEDDEQISRECWAVRSDCVARGTLAGAAGDERGTDSGDGEGEPAGAIHALVGEERCADGENHRHRSHHQRGVRDGGEGKAGELDEELKRDSHERCEQKESPIGSVEAWAVDEKQWRERERGEEEAVEDHGTDVQLDEGDFAEEEAASPERAGQGAGCKAESARFGGMRHGDEWNSC